MIAAARQWAFEILSRITTQQSYANLSLQEALRTAHLPDRDKALCTTLVYGTVQRQRSLDAILQEHCSRQLRELDKRVLVLLRMTAYQLLYLDKVPAYAALNDGVELCKGVNAKASGFVNAVIRGLLRDGRSAALRLQALTQDNPDWADTAGLQHSYPTWLVRRLAARFGRDRTTAMLSACNEPPSLSVRVNSLRTTRDALLGQLAERGDETAQPSELSPHGIRFSRGFDVSDWDAWLDGVVTVQDEGAMLVAPLLQLHGRERVLDLCAAPGGKTTHIAELQSDRGSIAACDLHPHKLKLIQEATARLRLHSIKVEAADGRTLAGRTDWQGSFDAVLVDAPCSGFGVLRHRPEIRWQRTEQDVLSLASLQVELLRAAVDLVRPGGVVVYSTCTLLPEENEDVVAQVVEALGSDVTQENVLADLPLALRTVGSRTDDGDNTGDCLLTPEQFGTDGFYMARLRKKENVDGPLI